MVHLVPLTFGEGYLFFVLLGVGSTDSVVEASGLAFRMVAVLGVILLLRVVVHLRFLLV